jgi:hypothetical protein
MKDKLSNGLDSIHPKIVMQEKALIKEGRVFAIVKQKGCDDRYIDFGKNLIVETGDILVASLAKGEPIPAVTHMALGSGLPWWDTSNPPVPVRSDSYLKAEYYRKAITSTQFVLSDGTPSANPTMIVDFVTSFAEGEPTGALMELGLFGGTDADVINGGYLLAYRIIPIWNIGADVAITFVWRVTF